MSHHITAARLRALAARLSRVGTTFCTTFFCALLALGALLLATVPAHAQETCLPNGAAGANIAWDQGTSSKWYIELQRTGADYIRDGLRQKNPALRQSMIQTGLTILNWGFAHQASDGSFPGTAGGSTGQMFHSTAIFLDAAAKATLQLRDFDPTTYAGFITGCTAHLQAAADWMLLPDVAAAGQAYNARFTHRRYMLASALAQIGALVADDAEAQKLSDAAAEYANAGLALMQPYGVRAVITHRSDWSIPPATLLFAGQAAPPQVNGKYAKGVHVINAWGVNPECGGYDVSYQMVGVQYAERYYPFCQDEMLKAHLLSMIRRACLWEMSRIDADGHIMLAGSTRVGLELNRAGVTKVANPDSVRCDFLDGYKITGDARLLDGASRLARQ